MAGVQAQVLDVLAGGRETVDGLGQQAAVGGAQHGDREDLRAVFEHGVGDAHLEHAAGLGVLVLGATAVGFQQVGAATVASAAGVQLDRILPQHVDAEAHGALGEARFQHADEALRPFFTVVLCSALGVVVALHIHVAGLDGQVGAFDKTRRIRLITGPSSGAGAGGGEQGGETDFTDTHWNGSFTRSSPQQRRAVQLGGQSLADRGRLAVQSTAMPLGWKAACRRAVATEDGVTENTVNGLLPTRESLL